MTPEGEAFVECSAQTAHQHKYWELHPSGARIICVLCHPPAALLRERAAREAEE